VAREGVAYALSECLRAGPIAAGHEHRELLAAETGGDVDSPRLAGPRAGDVYERAVTNNGTVLVVDRLEVIDVEDGDGDWPSVAPGVCWRREADVPCHP
jgi:hypothetical protein